jgi:hypothetical protein
LADGLQYSGREGDLGRVPAGKEQRLKKKIDRKDRLGKNHAPNAQDEKILI